MKRKVIICSETIIKITKIIANNSKHWEYYNNIFYMIHWNYYNIIVYIIIIKIIMIMSYVANFMLQSRKKNETGVIT